MGPSPYRDALAVNHGGNVVRMGALHFEGDQRSLTSCGADHAQRVDFTQASLGISKKLMLVRRDPFFADRIHIIDRSAESHRLDDCRRTRLEFMGRIAISDPVACHLANHLPATVIW